MNPNAGILPYVIVVAGLWSLFWKAVALWRSAEYKQKNWFMVIVLPINTLGILELIYLTRFCKNPLTWEQVKGWYSR